MSTILRILKFAIVLFVLSFSISYAQTTSTYEEAIISFDSTIQVNLDNSINVVETILYNSGYKPHHGIFRDIYPYSSTGKKMDITNITVFDERGTPHKFTLSTNGSDLRIKIGDPDVRFTGQKTYVISYHATYAIAQLQDVDEIYWNVTGNAWPFPIYQASATIILPSGISALQKACYSGRKGSTYTCPTRSTEESGVYVFNSPEELRNGEGLTVAVGFSKGIVVPYTEQELAIRAPQPSNQSFVTASQGFFHKPSVIGSIALLLMVFVFSVTYWFKNWRDPKGTGVIVAQYDVLDNLTPMEVSGIVYESITPKSISAEIIYFATRGYIKIKQIDTKTPVFFTSFTSTDYELILLTKIEDIENKADKFFLYRMFNDNAEEIAASLSEDSKDGLKNADRLSEGIKMAKALTIAYYSQGTKLPEKLVYKDTIKLSSLVIDFHFTVPLITNEVASTLLEKGYYKNLGKMRTSVSQITPTDGTITSSLAVTKTIFILVAIIIGFVCVVSFYGASIIFIALPAFIVFFAFWHFSPAKTERGVAAKEYLLGLKLYLKVAEKERLAFHNAPEKKPEVFEKLLPYAMVFGVDKAWAKEFETIYTTPPSWYEGAYAGAFSASAFNTSLNNFNTTTESSLGASPSSGGSGGGGSSGGGGGGGGGGSW